MSEASLLPSQHIEPSASAGRRRQLCKRLVIALVIAGVGCRLAQYLSFQSLWADETGVLQNLQYYTPRQLPFAVLDKSPAVGMVSAPALYLLITQWLGNHFGYHEWSVRLPPALCGILSVPLFAVLAWRLVSPVAAVWSVALFALSNYAIFEGATVKPYSGDTMFACLIPLLAFSRRDKSSPAARLAWASAVSALATVLSFPIIIIYASVALAMWPEFTKQRMRGLLTLAAASVPVGAAFAAVYFMSARREIGMELYSGYIYRFPDYFHPASLPGWFIGRTQEVFQYLFYPIGELMFPAAVAAIWMMRRKREYALLSLTLTPISLTLVAACLWQYPYGGYRTTLYFLPSVALCCGIGAEVLADLLPGALRWIQLVWVSVPASMIVLAVIGLYQPRNKGDLRDALAYVEAHRQPGEQVYLEGDHSIAAALSWFVPNPPPYMHLHYHYEVPIPADRYWMVITYDPKQPHDLKIAMNQPGLRIDPSRGLHTSGTDVMWFEPNDATRP